MWSAWQLRNGKELPDEFIRACDFIMPHGNGLRPDKLGPALEALKASARLSEMLPSR